MEGSQAGGTEKEEDALRFYDEVVRKEEWFSSNYAELEKMYSDSFVAVIEPGKVVADKDLKRLIRRLEEEGIDITSIYIEAIPPKGYASIL